MAGGRPLKFESVQDLKNKIDDYFRVTAEKDWMITGLAVFLDTSRDTLMDYEKGLNTRAEFSDTVKQAKLKIEMSYERRGINRGNAFDIFALKNFGWVDKQEIDQNVNMNAKIDLHTATDAELEKLIS